MRTYPAGTAILVMLGTALLCAVAAALLPTSAYQRHRQLDGTIYQNLGWIYERITYDPAPVDVAFVGTSRTFLGVNAPQLEADLAARGVHAKVGNLAVIGDGRDLDWMIIDELLAKKRPRLLVLEVGTTTFPYGHSAFEFAAPNRAILAPPLLGLHNWPYQLKDLPYRNLRLVAAALFPQAIGIPDRFDPARYLGTTPDTSVSFTLPTGLHINMDGSPPRAVLEAGAREFESRPPPRKLPPAIAARVYADDAVYTAKIADAARARGIPVMFLFIPYFSGPLTIADHDRYAAVGTVLNAGFVVDRPDLYEGWAHLNRKGAMQLAELLADRIAPVLAKPAAR